MDISNKPGGKVWNHTVENEKVIKDKLQPISIVQMDASNGKWWLKFLPVLSSAKYWHDYVKTMTL
jgi:hypothetical protein